jgi:DNA-binding MarR family transcriptional regulator
MGANTSRDDAQEALNAIRRVVRLLRLFDRRVESTTGLSAAQVFVLQQLSDGQSASINELAARTCTDQSSVSVVVEKLVRARLIRRQRSPRDGRRAEVSMTPRGSSLLRSAPPAAQQRLVAALNRMRPRSRKRLADGLGELIRNVGIDRAPADMFFEDRHPNRKGG